MICPLWFFFFKANVELNYCTNACLHVFACAYWTNVKTHLYINQSLRELRPNRLQNTGTCTLFFQLSMIIEHLALYFSFIRYVKELSFLVMLISLVHICSMLYEKQWYMYAYKYKLILWCFKNCNFEKIHIYKIFLTGYKRRGTRTLSPVED